MEASDGFIPIAAIFYAVFHPTEGTKIVHQIPEGSISTIKNDKDSPVTNPELGLSNDPSNTLFNFDTVKNYIIPKPQLCNKLLSFKIDKFKVIGYPVNIENPNYSRNSFNFNFCFVFPYDLGDVTPYEMAIKRMGKMFQVLEEQSFLLSKLDKDNSFFKDSSFTRQPDEISKPEPSAIFNDDFSIDPNFLNVNTNESTHKYLHKSVLTGPSANNAIIDNTPGHSRTKKITLSSIESLIHQIYQDLNNYSECCIPLDSANSVDIKLFPILPPPINIKAYQVPIASVKLNSLVDVNWDPTMVKILPYINGINSIKKISELADANYLLTKQCIQHLMHYKCIEITDIFQFSNVYAPTNHIGDFLKSNGQMAEECQAYVITGTKHNDSAVQTPNYVPTPNSSHAPNTSTNSPAPAGRKINPMNQFINGGKSSASPISKMGYLSKSPKTPSSATEGVTVSVPFKSTLFYLYRSLNQGQTVKEWYIQHRKLLDNVDIRRFIHFGCLRGIIYRVYSYPVLNSIVRAVENGDIKEYEYIEEMVRLKHKGARYLHNMRESNEGRKNEGGSQTGGIHKVSFSNKEDSAPFESDSSEESGDTTDEDDWDVIGSQGRSSGGHSDAPLTKGHRASFTGTNEDAISSEESDTDSIGSEEREEHRELVNLIKMLKGYQSYDSICTELQKSRLEVEKLIESLGSFSVVNS